jgi:hypothetical protein
MAKTTPQQKQRLRKSLGGAAKHRKLKKKLGVKPRKPKYAVKAQAAKKKRVAKRKVEKMTGGWRSKSKPLKNKRAKQTRVANRKGKKLTGGVNIKKYIKKKK